MVNAQSKKINAQSTHKNYFDTQTLAKIFIYSLITVIISCVLLLLYIALDSLLNKLKLTLRSRSLIKNYKAKMINKSAE